MMYALDTPTKRLSISDLSGIKDYVRDQYIYADYGVIVISAIKGELEEGIKEKGHIREHLKHAMSLGCQELIILISNMDHISVRW